MRLETGSQCSSELQRAISDGVSKFIAGDKACSHVLDTLQLVNIVGRSMIENGVSIVQT